MVDQKLENLPEALTEAQRDQILTEILIRLSTLEEILRRKDLVSAQEHKDVLEETVQKFVAVMKSMTAESDPNSVIISDLGKFNN